MLRMGHFLGVALGVATLSVVTGAYGGAVMALLGAGAKPGAPLAAGTYSIVSGANALDGGQTSSPWIAAVPTSAGSTAQQWVWDGSRLSNSLVAAGGSALQFDTLRNNPSYATISTNGLSVTSGGSGNKGVFTKPTKSTGKYNFKIQLNACSTLNAGDCGVGLADVAMTQADSFPGDNSFSGAYYDQGVVSFPGLFQTIATFAPGDSIDTAVDFGATLIWFRVNAGNWNNSGTANPATGAGGFSISGMTGTAWSPVVNIFAPSDQYTISAPPTISGFTGWGAGTGPPGPYMVQASGVPSMDASGDTFAIFASGAGYKVRNNRTGLYLSYVLGALSFSTTQTVWSMVPAGPVVSNMTLSPASPVNVSNSAPAGTLITTANVTMSDSSGFPGHITTSETTHFQISGMAVQTKIANIPDGTYSTTITPVIP